MSATEQSIQQLEQELQNELTISNQLLQLISIELQKIKSFTASGGEFENNIIQNSAIITELARLRQVNLSNLPPLERIQIQNQDVTCESIGYQQHDSFRNSMDDTQ